MNRTRALAAAVAVGALLAACSSGNTNVPLPAKPVAEPQVQFTVTTPVMTATSTATRKPQFTAPSGTQSLGFQLSSVNGAGVTGSPTIANIGASAPGCSVANATLTCTVTVTATAGQDLFTVTSYSQPNGKGNQLGTGQTQVDATSGTTTNAPVTLNGTVASIALAIQGFAVSGVSGTFPVAVIAKDANGATIMGTYTNPITLSDADTSGVTKLSATTLNDSTAATGITLTYSGSSLKSGAVLSASASGVDASKVTNATFTPDSTYTAGNGTFTYAQTSVSMYTDGTASPSPLPSPSGSPDTITETVKNGAAFGAQSNLMDVNSQDAATGTSGDTYYAIASTATGASVSLVGSNVTLVYSLSQGVRRPSLKSSSVQFTQTYNGAGMTVAQLPFTQTVWDASDGYTASLTDTVSSTTAKDTFNSDGSYTAALSATSGFIANLQATVNSDASATASAQGVFGNATIVIGTPEPAPSGAPGYVIPITETMASPSPAPSQTPDVRTFYANDWYPGGQAAPSPLASQHVTDKGPVAIPAQCNVSSSIATNAEQLELVSTQLDPLGMSMLGNALSLTPFMLSQTSDDYYASGVGLVCEIDTSQIQMYEPVDGAQLGTTESQNVLSLTKSTLQTALRHADSMSQATAIAGAGLQAAAVRAREQFLVRARQTFASRASHTLIPRS